MTKYIMVFNDTAEIQQLFADILTLEGYHVSLHTFTDQDVDVVRANKPALVIADCAPVSGEKNGWQLVQKLRMSRDTHDIPVVICSTSHDLIREIEGRLTEKGVIAVPKPFSPDELLIAVERMIGKADSEGLGPLADSTINTPQASS